MPSTTTSTFSFNYFFLLKCLAGVALCAFVIAMLAKPTYIVVAAAATLAPMAATAIFFPLVTLLALALLVTLAASISVARPGVSVIRTPTYPWYSVPYWFGPTYANRGWNDYFFNQQPNYHVHGNRTHHDHGHAMFSGHNIGTTSHQQGSDRSFDAGSSSHHSSMGGGHHHR